MKYIKRLIFGLLSLIFIGIIFRGYLYRNVVVYKSVGKRVSIIADSEKLISYINTESPNDTDLEVIKLIELGLTLTSQQLNFTSSRNDIDPNKLMISKTAHCIGYASFFVTTCNFLLDKYGLSDDWSASHGVGNLYMFDTNINNYFEGSFFKNHDFAIIKNEKTGELYAVDPTVHDYLFINMITFEE
jgi:hypothetical protein